MLCRLSFGAMITICATAAFAADRGVPWQRHTIDNTSRGADGVDLRDINNDGRLDIVSGWEEGGEIRVYLQPDGDSVRQQWPKVTVGKVKSPEDAKFIDLDQDGFFDVVSSCEGKTRALHVHWSPARHGDLLNADRWKTEMLPKSKDMMMWMWTTESPADKHSAQELFAAGKGNDSAIGRWIPGESPRDLNSWTWQSLRPTGWVMTLAAVDMDGDGDRDLLCSDRKGKRRGCFWLERPDGHRPSQAWTEHSIGGQDQEVMFLATGDLNADGKQDIACPTKTGPILLLLQTEDGWKTETIVLPEQTGSGKGAAIADVNGDGNADVVLTCEHSERRSGVLWFSRDSTSGGWVAHEISGQQDGTKFDLIRMIDLDGDGDLDLLTCEERNNLGVIWYENPQQTKELGKR